ncbi:MAG: DEAD/DEAH box helicase [Acidimicrobiales bacterium]
MPRSQRVQGRLPGAPLPGYQPVPLGTMSLGSEGGLAQALEALASHKGQIAHVEHLPATPARPGVLSTPLPAALQGYLRERGIELWSHQAETIEAVRSGADVVLTTSTASGKTLAFNLPVLELLSQQPKATALYLYPMKALANDQLGVLAEIEASTGIKVGAAVYDGDTPTDRRRNVRATSRLVITNPYGLHEYLPNHHLWERFFSRLAVVVIDEAHWYRGVFGSNVAMVLRRLRRICARYGSDPRFVLASATIANPAEHAGALVGKPHRVIAGDGAPHGRKDFVLWDSSANPDRSAHLQAAELLAYLAASGHQTICFTVSRKMAELVGRWAQEAAPAKRIVAYRAGYQPADRRKIEAELRDHVIDGVAATSALELGIDIGHLDAVIMAGYPGTICSTWQQAGRAGRSRAPSIAVLVAFDDPLDQYLVSHPYELFGRPHEHAVVDLSNPRILSGHLTCAAAELPLCEDDASYFGPQAAEAVASLTAQGALADTPMGHAYHGTSRPVASVRLDSIDEQAIEVRCASGPLETLSLRRALSTVHPGAILLHRGESYRIGSLDLPAGVATAVAVQTGTYSEVLKHVSLEVLREHTSRELGRARLWLGEVRTSEQVYAYKLKAHDRVLSSHELELPPVELDTVAAGLFFPPELASAVRASGNEYWGGLHGVEHAIVHMVPLVAMCDRNDVGSMSTPHHDLSGSGAIFLYDGYPGGIGIAEKAYEDFERLVEITLGLLASCGCESGCPSCIYDRACGSDNEPLDKAAAASLLRDLCGPKTVRS